jgi:hypothetical protein
MKQKLPFLVVGLLGLVALVVGVAVFVDGSQWGLLAALLGSAAAVQGLASFGRANGQK